MAIDEDTTFLSELRWARIRVKRDGLALPKVMVVTMGDYSFEIQLWWEIQPQIVMPQNRGVLLTTRQPVEYLWMSGNPTPLMKTGQSLLCIGSSTQRTTCPNHMATCPKFSQQPHRVHIQFKMSKNGHLDPCINTHKITYQLYTIV